MSATTHEPSGYQCPFCKLASGEDTARNCHAWHYHVHVFPRYPGDQLYASAPLPDFVTAEQRRPYADRLRGYFETTR